MIVNIISYNLKILSKLSLTLICIWIFLVVIASGTHAQVNSTSKSSSSDQEYYELLDVEVITDEVIVYQTSDDDETDFDDKKEVKNDTFGIFSINSEGEEITVFKWVEDRISGSGFLPAPAEALLTNLGLPALASTGVLLPFMFSLLPFLSLLTTPNLFLLALEALFGSKGNVIGIVYDKAKKEPIPFAVVKLYQSGSKSLAAQKVTDLEGRYGFVLSKGRYRLEIEHEPYAKYEQDVVIEENEQLFAQDLPLEKTKNNVKSNFYKGLKRYRQVLVKYSLYFSIFGLYTAIISYYLRRGTFEFVLVLVYAAIIGIYLYAKSKNKRNWGYVYDTSTNLRLGGAVVRLFNKKNILSDTQLTDPNGRFGFLVDPGEYSLLVNGSGYSFPSKSQTNFKRNEKNPEIIDIDYNKTNWVKLAIGLDPFVGNMNVQPEPNQSNPTQVINQTNNIAPAQPNIMPQGNLASPFN